MTTTALTHEKGSGVAKLPAETRSKITRSERLKLQLNERIARAITEYEAGMQEIWAPTPDAVEPAA